MKVNKQINDKPQRTHCLKICASSQCGWGFKTSFTTKYDNQQYLTISYETVQAL